MHSCTPSSSLFDEGKVTCIVKFLSINSRESNVSDVPMVIRPTSFNIAIAQVHAGNLTCGK